MTILKQSSTRRSFQITQLCQNLAICEALKSDRFNWGNATETEPAFLAYIGCSKDEVAAYIKTFNTFYRCKGCEIRQPKYLKDFEIEIKVREMKRKSDSHAFGLDYLVESESAKHIGCNEDEYQYYTTGYMPRW
ncbi:MAG: hypothetical protein ACRC06_11860 [Waterburya sp.]